MVCSSCNGRGWHGNTSDCKCLRCGGTGDDTVKLYSVADECMADVEVFGADSPDDAIRQYVRGYRTAVYNERCEEVNAARGVHYTVLQVWDGDDVVGTWHLIADGRGGVLEVAKR